MERVIDDVAMDLVAARLICSGVQSGRHPVAKMTKAQELIRRGLLGIEGLRAENQSLRTGIKRLKAIVGDYVT